MGIKTNNDIAGYLYQLANLLELSGDNPYRIRAYRRAAGSILQLEDNLLDLVKENFDLTSIRGIGKGIAHIILHAVNTNESPLLLVKRFPKKHRLTHFLRFYHALFIAQAILPLLKQIPGVEEVEWCGDFRRRKEIVNQLDVMVCTNHHKVFLAQVETLGSLIEETEHSVEIRAI